MSNNKLELTASDALFDLVVAIREAYTFELPIGVALAVSWAEDWLDKNYDCEWPDNEATRPDITADTE